MRVRVLGRAWRPMVGFGILVAVALIVLPAPSARGQQAAAPATYPMTVTQSRVPGATGMVMITPLGNNQIRVDINITGLPTSPSSRAAHIHTGPGAMCDNGAPVTYPLNDVMVDSSGHGTSTTTVTLTPDKPVEANNAYVNVHEQPSTASGGPGPGVICANITQSYTAGGTSATTAGATSASATVTTGQCVPGDSWCAYCSMAPSAAACKAFTPAHASGTTATGATGNSNDQPVPGVDQGLPPSPEIGAVPAVVPAVVPAMMPAYVP